MSAEPKRYFTDSGGFSDVRVWDTDTEVIRADDPAILKWKRDSEAMEKLDAESKKCPVTIYWDGEIRILYFNPDRPLVTAPTLLLAIESIASKQEEK
jgi:hypothetical protein